MGHIKTVLPNIWPFRNIAIWLKNNMIGGKLQVILSSLREIILMICGFNEIL